MINAGVPFVQQKMLGILHDFGIGYHTNEWMWNPRSDTLRRRLTLIWAQAQGNDVTPLCGCGLWLCSPQACRASFIVALTDRTHTTARCIQNAGQWFALLIIGILKN